jgi:eukaryotic-like serine/threonine-protein kinase
MDSTSRAREPSTPGSRCPGCGGGLPLDAPGGLCPRCLVQQVMANPVEENVTQAVEDRSVAVSPRDRFPSAFGNYELLDEIARGGMGVVYRARQHGLNRIVALKMILAGPFAGKQTILRFRAEAEAAANLRHANTVAIHETGEVDGQHYFSMDYVAGRNLADLVRDQPLTSKKAAEYVLKVARAVQYAHERKVLHRDLKPSNVLIDENDEPRITDFGLAKKLSGTSALTATGQLLGSPGYMPPEQASSRRGSFGPHSDVYSLGAVLFHLLTGRPPFQAENLTDTLDQLLNREPVPPRQLNPSVPPDLETICLKCLEKEPAKRYATADAVAEELGRFLRDEPILARPVNRAERLWRWCRRNPLLSSMSATVVLLLLTVSLGSPIAAFLINQSRARERNEAIAARQSLYAADMLLAQESYNQGNVTRAIDLLLRHRPKSGEDDLRGFAWRYLWRLCRQGDVLSTAVAHSGPLNQIDWSSQGLLATAGSDGVIQIYDSVRERIIATLNPGGSIRAVAFAPDGTLLATGDDRGRVLLWSVNPFESTRSLEFGGAIEALAFSPDRSWLVMSVLGIGLKVWSLHRDELLSQTLGGGRHAIRLAFSKDGRLLASGGSAMQVRLWTVPSFEEIAPIDEPHSGFSTGVAFSPDGGVLATGSWDTTIKLWEFPSLKLLSTLKGHLSHVWDLDISPDGRTLASASADGTIKLWPMDGELRPETAPSRTLLGHTGSVASVRFNGSGDLLASGSADHTVRLWNVHQTRPPNRLIGHDDWVYSVAVSSDRRRLATGSFDGTIRLWNPESLDSRVIENAHRNNVFTVIFSPTNPWLVSCDAVWRVNANRDFTTPGEVKIWEVETGSPIASLPGFRHRRARHCRFAARRPAGDGRS